MTNIQQLQQELDKLTEDMVNFTTKLESKGYEIIDNKISKVEKIWGIFIDGEYYDTYVGEVGWLKQYIKGWSEISEKDVKDVMLMLKHLKNNDCIQLVPWTGDNEDIDSYDSDNLTYLLNSLIDNGTEYDCYKLEPDEDYWTEGGNTSGNIEDETLIIDFSIKNNRYHCEGSFECYNIKIARINKRELGFSEEEYTD